MESIYIIHEIAVYGSSAIFCITLPLTLLAFCALCPQVLKGNAVPVYIINLLISDLIQFSCIIAELRYYANESTPVYIYSLMASVGFMACLSCERYMAITSPLKKHFMNSIKISVMVCAVVWTLPLVFLLPHHFCFCCDMPKVIFCLFFFLPCPPLIFFLCGALKAFPASTLVPSDEKRQIVGILVLVLLIYTLLFLPGIIWFLVVHSHCIYWGYKDFVFPNYEGFKDLSVLFIRLIPPADFVLYVFMSKGAVDKLLASLCCYKMKSSDVNMSKV